MTGLNVMVKMLVVCPGTDLGTDIVNSAFSLPAKKKFN